MATRTTHRIIQVVVLVVLLLAANAFLGYSIAQESERAITDQIRSRMTDLACSAASLLDGDSVKEIDGAKLSNAAYAKAYGTLGTFQNNTDITYVYLLRKIDDGTYVYIVDPAEDDEAADYGEKATYTDALSRAADGTPSVDLVAYEDRWGRFYTAYCPVFDSWGNVSGIVGVDFEAAWYEDHANAINRMAVINSLASLLLALIAVVVIARMTRAETKHAENLEHANRYDALTGLPNMSYFFKLAEASYAEMTAKGEEAAMLYMDLVNMRAFNTKHGFAGGDRLLKAFAALLAEHFGHDRCGRFGQDHFAVSTNAENLDERLDAFIAQYACVNGGLNTPVHIGIHLDSLNRDLEASTACDHAKTACDACGDMLSSNWLYFSEDMMERAKLRQHVIDNIDRAIDEGWITVHYQPIVRASTGKVCNEEALARWIDPEFGLLSPAEFIPALEDVGLAYKLDLNVLEQTLAKMKGMEEAGLYVVPSSINLSRSDFEACDIVEEIRMRVDASPISRDKICVEITETAIGRDYSFMSEQIDRFHALGFQVWMDDFGSEYSSLDYLQRLNFDLLKLDMRFMQQFDSSNDKSKIILAELVKMALGLGIETIAEGVETWEQVDFLRKVGCSKLQGYHFAKPQSFDSILERYKTGLSIGFENPAESNYYSALGRTNLYDLSSITRGDDIGSQEYFDTLPMAVLECTTEGFSIMRCNRTYYRFIKKTIGDDRVGVTIPYNEVDANGNNAFIQAIQKCSKYGMPLSVDEVLDSGLVVHSFIRHIAANPVTGAEGIAVAILTITKS